jgi:peptidoglycan hydrolase CwlO-like protein
MTTLLLGRPLTFWDEEQISWIKEQEAKALLYQNPKYKKLQEKIDDKRSDIRILDRQIERVEIEISEIELEIDELEEEQNEIKKMVIKNHPYLKDIIK